MIDEGTLRQCLKEAEDELESIDKRRPIVVDAIGAIKRLMAFQGITSSAGEKGDS